MVGPPPPPPPPMPFMPPNDQNMSTDLTSNQKEIKVNQQKVGSERNELLEQIRGGIRLKKAESTKERSNESTDYESSGNPLASALSKALQNRFRVNQMNDFSSDSSEEKNEETNYNEWSD